MGTTFYQQSDNFMVTILRCHIQCCCTILEMDKKYLCHIQCRYTVLEMDNITG